MTNHAAADALREIGLFLAMEGVPFKPAAYEKAAYAVEALERPISELYASDGTKALTAIPGVGKSIAHTLEELLRSGRVQELEEQRRKTPVDLLGLTRIEGCGPKRVKALHAALGVRTVADLEAACRAGRVRRVPTFGEKTEARLLHGIEILEGTAGRMLLGRALPVALAIEASLRALPFVQQAVAVGSVRRRKETIGDFDLLAVSTEPARVAEHFARMPDVVRVHAQGPTKALVRLSNGLDADLRVVPARSFGAALLYFTGSKAHNVKLRRLAIKQGLKLNEYGLFRGTRAVASWNEEDIYDALGLAFIPPELREDEGEIEAASEGALPRLIEHGDLRGDLQVQTNWTDGSSSIAEMAEAARRLGHEYIAITDHTRDLAMTGGCDEARLRQQAAEIRRLNQQMDGFRILSGAEVNIRKDGTLDIADRTLAELDVVGVAVHSFFDLGRDESTRRIVRAIENPHVDILFHPTARSIGRRAPLDVDFDAILAAAQRTGTVLEIDAAPERLDLRDELVRKAVGAGVRLSIDSDAHQPSHLAYADELGVAVARRGWATKADVVNTRSAKKLLSSLKGGGHPASASSR